MNNLIQWIKNIFEPYHYQIIKANPDLNDNQAVIIYLDCYSVLLARSSGCTFLMSSLIFSFVSFMPVVSAHLLSSNCFLLLHSIRHWHLPACWCGSKLCHQTSPPAASNPIPCEFTPRTDEAQTDSRPGQVHNITPCLARCVSFQHCKCVWLHDRTIWARTHPKGMYCFLFLHYSNIPI